MKKHIVKQGEDIVTIAYFYGISDWKSIYDHEANSRLKEYRSDPMCLLEGDIVYIPDLEHISYVFETNQKHTITIEKPKVKLSLKLLDEYDEPLEGTQYEIIGKGINISDKTGSGGVIEYEIDIQTSSVVLRFWPDKDDEDYVVENELLLGHLDPIDELTGIQSRLENLGELPGKIDGDYGPVTQASAMSFEDDVEGDEEFLSKLKSKYE